MSQFRIFSSKDEGNLNNPKVLIHVSPGIADYVYLGDVDIEIADEDNINAGDSPMLLDVS